MAAVKAIEAQGLSFSYPEEAPAVGPLDWRVEEGAFQLLVGATGSGKTTLLRCLKPAFAPAGERSGSLKVFGRAIDELDVRESAATAGYVSQSPENQIVCDAVWHELAFGLENLGVRQDTMRRRVAETAHFFGIEPWFRRSIDELSGGQKQMVTLASVLAMQPRLLVLDEPTAQLDPVAEKNFLHALFRVNRELGITVVVATHAPEAMAAYATAAVQLRDGGVEDVPLEHLEARPLRLSSEHDDGSAPSCHSERRCEAPELKDPAQRQQKKLGLSPRGILRLRASRFAQDDKDARASRFAQDDKEAHASCFAQGDKDARASRFAQDDKEAHASCFAQGDKDARASRFAQDDKEAHASCFARNDEDARAPHLTRNNKEARAPRSSQDDKEAYAASSAQDRRQGPPAASLRDAYVRYRRDGDWVLRGCDVEVAAGCVHAVVGGNGCGKSTLLRTIAGVLKPERGRVDNRFAARQVLLPQDPKALFVCDSVAEELREWQAACGYDEAAVDGALARFGLVERASSHPYDLSGGEQQKLALAKLLLTEPDLLLLDEPTKGLDAPSKLLVGRMLRERARNGRTIVMATHDLSFAALVSDTVSMVFDGEAACTEPGADFFANNLFYRPMQDAFACLWNEDRR